jgi:hypothetical protein
MSEHLACHRTVGASIVMLVASGLAGSGLATFPVLLPLLPAVPEDQRSSPGSCAGVRSRQAVGSGPRTFSFHLAVPRPSFNCRSGLSVPPGRNLAFLCVFPSRQLTTFQLRATRCICGSLGSLRGVFRACFPTLLRASLPGRSASVFPFGFSGFPPKPRCGFIVSTPESCAPKVSRASGILGTYPQGVVFAVDNHFECREACGFGGGKRRGVLTQRRKDTKMSL